MIYHGIEFLFLFINLLMAAWHRHLILENRPIVHWLWAAFYIALVIPFWLLTKNPILVIGLFLVREVFFSPFLNLIRGKGFFYQNVDGPNSSLLDKVEDKWQPFFYFIAVISLIILNIFL
jgi:hypothetical protein